MTHTPDSTWPGDLRRVTDADADAVSRLIGACFAEYEGCVLDPDGVDSWMAAPASSYDAKGGVFWVLTEGPAGSGTRTELESGATPGEADLLACVGWAPDGPGRVELKNLYVRARARRQGLARRLVERVEQAAGEQAAGTVHLWSDTRFLDAHRLYENLGYQRDGTERALHDPSNSVEYGFVKTL